METKDKRNGWKLGLKVGSQVLLNHRYTGTKLGIVSKITPTGIMTITHDKYEIVFNADGWERGRDVYNSYHLEEATTQAVEKLKVLKERQGLYAEIKAFDFSILPLGKMKDILEVLKR